MKTQKTATKLLSTILLLSIMSITKQDAIGQQFFGIPKLNLAYKDKHASVDKYYFATKNLDSAIAEINSNDSIATTKKIKSAGITDSIMEKKLFDSFHIRRKKEHYEPVTGFSIYRTLFDKSFKSIRNDFANAFWDSMRSINISGGNLSQAFGILSNELYWDNIGWLRFGVSTGLVNGNNDTIRDFKTFAETGGNVNFKLTYPLAITNFGRTSNGSGKVLLSFYINNRVGILMPKIGTVNQKLEEVINDAYISADLQGIGRRQLLGFAFGGKLGLLYNSNKESMKKYFEDNVSVSPYFNYSIGVSIVNKFYLTVNSKLFISKIKTEIQDANFSTISLSFGF